MSLRYAVLAIAAAFAFSGCVTTPQSVLKAACDRKAEYSTERCAKGIAETYEVYQKRGEGIVTNPATPADVKRAVKKADAAASPVMVDGLKLTGAYVGIKGQLAAGTTTEEQLAIATQNLEAWVALALPLIDDLVKAVGGK